jgi:hypothetical protein
MATHNPVLVHEIAVKLAGASALTRQEEALAGSVDIRTWPVSSTAAHNLAVGQETALMSLLPSTFIAVHNEEALAGLMEARMVPAFWAAMHNAADGQESPLSWGQKEKLAAGCTGARPEEALGVSAKQSVADGQKIAVSWWEKSSATLLLHGAFSAAVSEKRTPPSLSARHGADAGQVTARPERCKTGRAHVKGAADALAATRLHSASTVATAAARKSPLLLFLFMAGKR